MPRRRAGNNLVMGTPSTAVASRELPGRSTHRRNLLLGIVVVALAALVIGRAPRGSSPRTVPVVGDSITVFSSRDISTVLSGAYRPAVHAQIGARIDQMLPTLRALLRAHPYAVVVNLGTNDVLQAHS